MTEKDTTTIVDSITGEEYEVTDEAICNRCEISLRQSGEDYCSMCVMDLGGPAKPWSEVNPEDFLA